MMRLSERSLLRAGAVGAGLGLFCATLAGAPASADTGVITYTCSASILTNQPFTAVIHGTAPETVTVGDTVSLAGFSADVKVNSGATGALYWILGARSVAGSASVEASVDNAGTSVPLPNLALDIPSAPVPSSGELAVVAGGTGPSFVTTTAGVVKFQVGSFTADLTATSANGTQSSAPVTCVLNADQDTTIAAVNVVDALPES